MFYRSALDLGGSMELISYISNHVNGRSSQVLYDEHVCVCVLSFH